MTNPRPHLELMTLLAPARIDRMWEAEKSGLRCYVMGNDRCTYRRGSKLRTAWQHGYYAASRSSDPLGQML